MGTALRGRRGRRSAMADSTGVALAVREMRVGEGTGRPAGSGAVTKATVRAPDFRWETTVAMRIRDTV